MKTNLIATRIALVILSIASYSACNQQPANRAGADKTGATGADQARVCGTNVMVENQSNKTKTSELNLNVRPELCGRVSGSNQDWKALGRGVVTSSVYLTDSEDSMESAKKYSLVAKGKEVFAVNGSKEIKVGRLDSTKHGSLVIFDKNIEAQLGANKNQNAYELSAKMKKPEDERVFLIMPSLRKKS